MLDLSSAIERKSESDPFKVSLDQSQIPFAQESDVRLNQSEAFDKMIFEPDENQRMVPNDSSFVGENSIILIEEAVK